MEGTPNGIKQENQNTFEFYAEANKIITLNLGLCQGCKISCNNKIKKVKDAKFKVDDFELEVKEVGSWKNDGILSFHYGELGKWNPFIPFSKFSFRPISENHIFQPSSF